MDPVTLWLFCLATAVLVRRLVEDGWAALNNREAPSIARRRARQALAQQQAVTTGAPGVGQAIADRLASRIANPPIRRALPTFRSYLDELLADAWDGAREHHHRKRQQRTNPQSTFSSDDVVDAEVVEDLVCGRCRREPRQPGQSLGRACLAEQRRQDSADPPDSRGPAKPDPDPDPDPDPYPDPDPDPYPASEPTTATDSTREGIPSMTRSTPPVVIDGDVHDPTGALAHVQACTHFVQQLSLQAEIAANNLEGLGVGGEAVGEIRGLQDAAAQFLAAADAAAERFTHHVRAQADLAANPALAGTTAGTYLDAARA